VTETETLASIKRVGWWSDHENHPYFRLSVQEYIDEFCGWKALTELINLIPSGIQRSFFVTMFQTGGRALEVLLLKKDNFTVMPDEGIIKITDMRLLKKYKKLDGYLDSEGKNRWHTLKLFKKRKTFTIQRREPFTPILEAHLESIKQPEAYLFPSPYSHRRQFKKNHALDKDLQDVNGKVPYSVVWAYLNIRQVSSLAPVSLKQKLGLMTPLIDEETGKVISDEIHLWLHWFRSQKACQLANDYNFDAMDLLDYFSWTNIETPIRYAKKGWHSLTEKMNKAQVNYA
jgi:hypothetical protein